jgi:hypothetical protein
MTDITPDWPGYSGPKINLTWHGSVAIAQPDSPGARRWVLVPLELARDLAGLARAAKEMDDLLEAAYEAGPLGVS